jgi:hypothetical protein
VVLFIKVLFLCNGHVSVLSSHTLYTGLVWFSWEVKCYESYNLCNILLETRYSG